MKNYKWAVIGAGPAGIAAIGKLLDEGISALEIAWIDPQFNVGDFGTLWRNVPSNTKVNLFEKFLFEIKSFLYDSCPHYFDLHKIDKNSTCQLDLMADPLQWVSDHLKETVCSKIDFAEKISYDNKIWTIHCINTVIQANNVILATGSEPKTLPHSALSVIPLQDAMDQHRIQSHISANDCIAVFGSSHSAMLALRNLVEIGANKIINIYRSPLCYAVYYDDWILHDDTGLKGSTAEWARQNIDGELPKNLERIHANTENINNKLAECNKVVYAIGFNRRELPIIEFRETINFSEQPGIIAPGLFGFGIAYPEAKVNPFGILEHRVGLWKFMDYLNRVMPSWLNYADSPGSAH